MRGRTGVWRRMVIAAAVWSLVVPGQAQASVTGTLAFSCSMRIHRWPRGPFGNLRCRGAATGLLTGSTLSGSRYTASASGATTTLRFFRYVEACPRNVAFPPFGNAQGVMSANLRSISPPGPAGLSTFFFWTRLGGVLVGSVENTHVTLPGGRHAVGEDGVFVGAWTPTSIPPSCDGTGVLGVTVGALIAFR